MISEISSLSYSSNEIVENINQNQNYVGTKILTDNENYENDENKEEMKCNYTLYISGIDTYGDISQKSRSDVNIIASINTDTRNILLTSTPRDYYVKIPMKGGVKDKLTHAGIYGVDVSIKTLENLYDISIDYYIRINFTTFINIIDLLGGITVYSEYDFISGNYSFNKGYNELNGEDALVFVRERYAFSNGDNQRGKNQMQVIKAIIDKAFSPTVIIKSSDIINTISKALETNMNSNEIKYFIKLILKDKTKYNIEMNNVKGADGKALTYSSGNKELYVMIPDIKSVNEAKLKMKKVMNQFDERSDRKFNITY